MNELKEYRISLKEFLNSDFLMIFFQNENKEDAVIEFLRCKASSYKI